MSNVNLIIVFNTVLIPQLSLCSERGLSNLVSDDLRPGESQVIPFLDSVSADDIVEEFAEYHRETDEKYVKPLECDNEERANIFAGTQWSLQSDEFPNFSPKRSRCTWSVSILAGTYSALICPHLNCPCKDGAEFSVKISGRRPSTGDDGKPFCTHSERNGDIFHLKHSDENALKVDIHYNAGSGNGSRVKCYIRGMGGGYERYSQIIGGNRIIIGKGKADEKDSLADECGKVKALQTQDNENESERTTNRPHGYIVSGKIAKKGSWPWMVSMTVGYSHFCGGTIIAKRTVLTAAHCVEVYRKATIQYGCHRYKLDCKFRERASVSLIHPQYRLPQYDMALVKLSLGVFSFSDFVSPVCLPPVGSTMPKPGNVFSIAGWGRTNGGDWSSGSEILKEAKVRNFRKSVCLNIFGLRKVLLGKGRFSMDSVLCTRPVTGSVCQGDSGGFLGREENGTWFQYGVTSFGTLTCSFLMPSGFAKTTDESPAKMATWIRENL